VSGQAATSPDDCRSHDLASVTQSHWYGTLRDDKSYRKLDVRSVRFQPFSKVLWQFRLHPQSDLGSKRPACFLSEEQVEE